MHRIGDPVVRVTQCGVAVVEQEAVLLGIGAFDPRLLRIRVEIAVDQREDLRAVGQVGAVDVAAQPLPVLRLVVGLDRPVVEVIELLDVLFERLRTAYGQFRVVGIGAFGRSVALEPDRGDRYVGVGAYGVDRILDFLQFRRIAAVVGIDDGLVDGEVDECRSVDREDLHRIGFRPDVDEARDVDERGFVEAQHVALFVEQRAAAPVVLPVEDERGSVHPRLVGAAGAVCDGIRLFRGPEVPPPD